MANRSMQAKALKLKRQKRLFPRYLGADYIPTGKPPNQMVMQELKERARGLAFDEEYADYLQVRKEMDRQGQHISEGRVLVAAHIQRIQNVAPALMNVVICNTKIQKTKLFYNEERNKFVLYEENALTKEIRTSMVYMDRARCIAHWRSDTVRWVYFSSVRLPTPSAQE